MIDNALLIDGTGAPARHGSLADLSLEQAVQAVTSRPAMLYRIPGRGRLAAGAWADLCLFDPATVGRGPKRRVFDLPAGASRIDTPAVGLHGV